MLAFALHPTLEEVHDAIVALKVKATRIITRIFFIFKIFFVVK